MSFQKNYGMSGAIQARFENILYEKIQNLLLEIKIENPSRRILAFKSLHWAQRWANPNLKIFSERLKLVTPYYDDKYVNSFVKSQMNIFRIEKFK